MMFGNEDKILSSSVTGDFSLTFWLFLPHESFSQSRVVLLKKNETAVNPLILLRDNDRRLEIFFEFDNGKVSDKIVSKTDVPLNSWTHVALVSEGCKVTINNF